MKPRPYLIQCSRKKHVNVSHTHTHTITEQSDRRSGIEKTGTHDVSQISPPAIWDILRMKIGCKMQEQIIKCQNGVARVTAVIILASHWFREITWVVYWPLIGREISHELFTLQASDWSREITWVVYRILIGRVRSIYVNILSFRRMISKLGPRLLYLFLFL